MKQLAFVGRHFPSEQPRGNHLTSAIDNAITLVRERQKSIGEVNSEWFEAQSHIARLQLCREVIQRANAFSIEMRKDIEP